MMLHVVLLRIHVSERCIASILSISSQRASFAVIVNVVPSSPIVTLMIEAIYPSETSLLTRAIYTE
jgi:hypothetical protein